MIIFRCVICNDEMFVDTFKMKVTPDEMFYEVEGKMITRQENFNEDLIAANASAEEAVESTEDATVTGVDIVLNHKLQETCFTKQTLIVYLKEYMKTIKAHLEKTNPERVEKFVASSPAAVKRVISDLKNFQFFTGESMDPKGIVGLLNFREDGCTPYMLFFKDGLITEKY